MGNVITTINGIEIMLSKIKYCLLLIAGSALIGCGGSSSSSNNTTTETSNSATASNIIGATSEQNCREAADQDNSACFIVDGTNAEMYGVINSNIVSNVNELLTNHSSVKNIILMNVPGSADDDSNLAAARIIYNRGINTELKATSSIASGGVDFFLAGTNRVIAQGAIVGVHSWADSDGTQASQLPMNDKQHDSYISYYTEIKMDDPSGFYFFTINAAPASSIHNMTDEEITFYKLRRP